MKIKEELAEGELSIDVKVPSGERTDAQGGSEKDDQEYQTKSEGDSSDEDNDSEDNDSEEPESSNQSEESDMKQAPTTGGVHSSDMDLSLIHISEPTRLLSIAKAGVCV